MSSSASAEGLFLFIIRISFAHTTPKPQKGAKRVEEQNRRSGRGRRVKLAAVYLLAALAAALGWLNACLPDRVYLEPEQALVLPRFGWVEPLRLHGSQNVVSTRAVGSYQTTLALGGWLPVKTIRTVVTTRPSVTVCGTPFGVKMFSEGALIVGFSDVDRADGGTANPAKAAGLHLGDRVVCIGETATENNDAVKAALDAAQGAEVEVIYIRGGEQLQTILTPAWDATAGQWRAGMWVRDSSAGVGTLTFADEEKGVFAGLGHPISDSDTGESIALRSGEIVPCQITGYQCGSYGSLPRGAGAQRRRGDGRGERRAESPAENALRAAAGGPAGCIYAGAGRVGRQTEVQCRRGAPHRVFCDRCVPE